MKKPFIKTIDTEASLRYKRTMTALSFTVLTMAAVIAVSMNVISSWIVSINMTKTEKYLYGTGSYGAAPDDFVGTEQYYSAGLMSKWYRENKDDPDKLAYMMYRYACLTYGTTAQKSWHLYGEGKVATGTATGKLTASGYRYEKRRGDTMLADSVLQNINILSDVSGSAGDVFLLSIAKGLVQYGEQRVYSADYEYIRTADEESFYIEDEYDLAMAAFSDDGKRYDNAARVAYKKGKGYVYREYGDDWYDDYGLNSPEKTDHIINTESIIAGSTEIKAHLTPDLHKYFTVSFKVDTNKILSSGTTAAYYFEQFIINHMDLKEGSFSMFDVNVKYNALTVTMEIWDCGYLRSWCTDEDWSVTAALASIKVPAHTLIATKEYYSYNPSDNLFDSQLAEIKAHSTAVNADGSNK